MGIINILFFLLILGPFPHDGFCCTFSCFGKSIGQSIHFRYVRGRSSRPEVFCKKGIHINFAKFTGKYLHQSLFKNTFFNKTLPVPAFVEVTNFSLRLKIGVKIKIELTEWGKILSLKGCRWLNYEICLWERVLFLANVSIFTH